ncbi:transcription-repair coupling factor [Vagococcus lutrae]|uniref:transcription-repair coupling factor n=1 Tax=Vagococcus lutrae TaxID=81947 RepID=UPI00288F271E|nr:transcription-repair coupling factor [Vagococcus lutrae]MDT2801986.1 transcription-repair coupling factor [Vagococcus lutrae]MDT2826089.1 transcription-repair coupling factor [Vagococcus lutrae]
MELIKKVMNSPTMQDWLSGMEQKQTQLVTGLTGSAKTLTLASLYYGQKRKLVVVTPNLHQMNQLLDDLSHLVPEEELYSYPVNEVLAVEMGFASPEAIADRIEALSFLYSNRTGILVVPAAGARHYLPSKETWQRYEKELAVGDTVEIEHLTQDLITMGYVRESMVGKPGEFSVRGGIVDVYPLTSDYPFRIDFFDDEIDSLRYFEADTQRSIENVEKIEIKPATDVLIVPEVYEPAADKLQKDVHAYTSKLKDEEAKQATTHYMDSLTTQWRAGERTLEDRHFIYYLMPDARTMIEHLAADDAVILDDYSRILEVEKEMLTEQGEWISEQLALHKLLPSVSYGREIREILKKTAVATSYFSVFQKGMGNLKFQQIHHFQVRTMQQFFGQMGLFEVELNSWKKKQQTVIMLTNTIEKSQKIQQLLREHAIEYVVQHDGPILEQAVQIRLGELQTGFELIDEKLVVVTEHELLQVKKRPKARKRAISNAERLKSYNELKTGDYVVHVNHGIGKYIGMETLEMDGVHQDYMTIVYQNNDKLFIPVTQLDLIQKYVASESKTPKINKLGGTEWTKTKRKVASKVEDIADDLIQLYAAREAEKGFAFSPDDNLQAAFDNAFPYSETDDQLRSIQEIKRDMEKAKPMDRLLVGDVGYGKTEVALRAVFKAVRDNKQVAFLVPTTILAQQHYETMLERFADFPVNVELLSRFRTKKQQTETIEKLEKGQADVVVGTHRILSKDVVFQDLGLLIIDEEQRFGVKHKERLKQLRSEVDVLTLTATPIPRTLHMSMLGVRDLSVIETPPSNRYPVQTYVMEQNIGAIRDGIERELARSGQVFYLHNRVDTIEQKVGELQQLVPDARIAFAHGQMTEVQLENILFDFINREYDVLVTTTIIETGVDIPNVNTLFVESADHMGLSQLYQLRGRVGRSNRVAFAYLMYEPQKVLTEVSEKRLQAMKDFTELGSGFKLAMRDLSIRGAGNILGSQQHGFIDSVGFDLYTQMLNEAVQRKQGKQTTAPKTVVEIQLGVDAYIPNAYIPDERQKIEIYKRVRELENQAMYEELVDDVMDRFGEFPDEVAYLLAIGRIKMNSERALIEKIEKQGQKVTLVLSVAGTKTYMVEQLFKALAVTKLKADMRMNDEQMHIILHLPNDMMTELWLNEIGKVTEALQKEREEAMTKQTEAKDE